MKAGALVLSAAVAVSACHRDPPPRVRLKAIHRCEDGTAAALGRPTRDEALSVFYAECAGLFVELDCKRAWERAAKAAPAERAAVIVEGCRKAYCPIGRDLEACRPDFVTTNESGARAMTPLVNAILSYDAGAYLPQIQRIVWWFYARLPAEAPAAASSG